MPPTKNGNGITKYGWMLSILLPMLGLIVGVSVWGGAIGEKVTNLEKSHIGISAQIEKKFDEMALEQKEWREEQGKIADGREKMYDKRWERDEKVRDRILLKLDQLTNTP